MRQVKSRTGFSRDRNPSRRLPGCQAGRMVGLGQRRVAIKPAATQRQGTLREVGGNARGAGDGLVGGQRAGRDLWGKKHLATIRRPKGLDGIVAHEPAKDGQTGKERALVGVLGDRPYVADGIAERGQGAGTTCLLPLGAVSRGRLLPRAGLRSPRHDQQDCRQDKGIALRRQRAYPDQKGDSGADPAIRFMMPFALLAEGGG